MPVAQPADCSFTPEITGIVGSQASVREWRSQPQPHPRTCPQEAGHLCPRLWPQPLSPAEIPPLLSCYSVLLAWVELCPPKFIHGRPDHFPQHPRL